MSAQPDPLAAGKRSRERTTYLAYGNVHQRSLPYVASEAVHWITMAYYAIGSVLTRLRPLVGELASS